MIYPISDANITLIYLVRPDASEEEVEKATDPDGPLMNLDDPNNIFNVLNVTNVQASLKAMQERHELVKILEKRVTELTELMNIFAQLVQEQGNRVNSIGKNLEQIEEDTREASQQLMVIVEEAKKNVSLVFELYILIPNGSFHI